MSWFWRTKPRSITKTLQWFPQFGALMGQNWDEKSPQCSNFNNKNIYPTRRSYIYYAHGEEDSWFSEISFSEYLSGTMDKKETESNGRNDKTTFEFYGFGYVTKDGCIKVTESGQKIMQGSFDQERYLKQLLKLHLPNPIQKIKTTASHPGVFPMKLVLKAFSSFDYLSRSELALLFGCDTVDKEEAMISAIKFFKEQYALLPNKLDTGKIKQLFTETYEQFYGPLENKPESFYDYGEALSRSLLFTGLFTSSGRSIHTKLRVASHATKKVELLKTSFEFQYPAPFSSLEEYMDWYGSDQNVLLPWDKPEERMELVQDKLNLLYSLMEQAPVEGYQQSSFVSQTDLDLLFLQTSQTQKFSHIKDLEHTIDEAIIHHNENHFIKVSSKSHTERSLILEKFKDILANDDMSALWLEVNTWKSLISINGIHQVKRNFQVEEDLSPKSFAPGMGNTPDMELYFHDIILLPEVSLMTGVRQWEHEASSVIDHVFHQMKKEPQKHIYGLFISSKIHTRTMWQFFLLNRESWLGKPLPVVPLTIDQYVAIIHHCYKNNYDITRFLNLIIELSSCTANLSTYTAWSEAIEDKIHKFIS